MEPIVSKSLPVSLNQHRSHGPIFTNYQVSLALSPIKVLGMRYAIVVLVDYLCSQYFI